jgi:LAO/AO transport system kinase
VTGRPDVPVATLFARATVGDRGALARLITVIERGGENADELADLTEAVHPTAHIVGITGAPGTGKSSLTGHLLVAFEEAGRSPAVLAIDPSSPVTGGAILGDRVRMDGLPHTAFVRSMATRGHQGGLAFAVPDALRLLACVGFDPVIVETTGVGQVEVDIATAADTTVLVVAPGWGDAVQANKAGLLEVADVLVVNKADRPGAKDTRRDLELMLDLGHISGHEALAGRRPSILMTTSTTGVGASDVRDAIDAHHEQASMSGRLDERRRRRLRLEVRGRVEKLLGERISAVLDSDAGRAWLAAREDGRMSSAAYARAVAAVVAGESEASSPAADVRATGSPPSRA